MTNWPHNRAVVETTNEQQLADWSTRFADTDKLAGIKTTEEFRRFSQRDDIFNRAFYDDEIRSSDSDGFFNSYRMSAVPRRAKGFDQRDFALRNASWSVSDMVSARSNDRGIREGFTAAIEISTPIAEPALAITDQAATSAEIKAVAKLFGADLAGIAEYDERWTYSASVDIRDFSARRNDLPDDITHVIVLGHEMDKSLVDGYPSALAGTATGLEYSRETAIVIQLASYIRNLGYQAIPSMNDTGLAIPLAIVAGLGEYARNQLVITPEFGPRVRFSKVYTSLPLVADKPSRPGVAAYCQICTKCASACPPRALPFGDANSKALNRSTISGVVKWSADCEKCFGYWAKMKSDCAICMRVCPFNRDYQRGVRGWPDRLWRWLALSRLRKLALWWDQKWPSGSRTKPADWWRGLRAKSRR